MAEPTKQACDVIMRVLRERLGSHGFRDATILAGNDHDGDPVIFVTAHFDLVPKPLDASITFDMTSAIQDALEPTGETRFPIVSFDFHERQEIATRQRRKRA